MKIGVEYIKNCGEVWLQYAVRLNLLKESKADLADLKNNALENDHIKACLHDVSDFHGTLVRNHKNPELPIHKLLFLLDLGFDMDVPEIKEAVTQIMEHKDQYGIYQSLTNIPEHYGGDGKDTFGWCLCDAPLLLMALLKAGIDYEKHIRKGVDYLISLHKAGGFPCSVSEEHGKFRGPGRKDDCCPYATLIMINLLSCIPNSLNAVNASNASNASNELNTSNVTNVPENQYGEIVKDCIETILFLWENSMERHPYMFYMGTDFRKLKAPALWYDLVSVTDCLSKFDYARKDARFQEMILLIKNRQTEEGGFIPEAVYQKYKGWDFGQKKNPSPYLTFLCERIFQQAEA